MQLPEPPPPAELGTPIDPKLDTAKVLREVVDDHLTDSMNFLAAFYPKWQRYYQLYRSFTPKKQRPWRANIFVPITFANVEHGLASMLEAWYSTRPLQKVLPREGNDYDDAMVVEGYLDWEDDDMSSYLPMYEINKEMLIYGTGWSKLFWDWRYDRNALEAVSVWNFHPDPSAKDLDEAEWVIHRALRSPSWIRRMVNLGVYDMDQQTLEKVLKEGMQFVEKAEQILQLTGQDSRTWKNRIEVLEEWRDGWVITVLNRRYVVRARRNPFKHRMKPFGRWVDHGVPHELLGIGEIEVLEKLQEEINDIRNQRLDVVSLLINNMLIAARTANVDPDSLVIRPGGIVWADTTEGVKPLMQGGNPSLSVQEEQMSRFDIQEATGNWGYNQGQTPARREAATTVLALQRASGMRFTAKVRLNEEGALKRMAQMRVSNAQQYMPPQRWVRITGKEGPQVMQMSPEEMPGRYDFVLQASSAVPKETRRAQVGQILPLLLRHPKLNQDEFLDWLLDLYEIKERQKFILSDEQAAMRMALMQAAQGRVQGGQGGQAPASPTLIGAPGAESTTGAGMPDLEGIEESEGGGPPVGAGVLSQFLRGGE